MRARHGILTGALVGASLFAVPGVASAHLADPDGSNRPLPTVPAVAPDPPAKVVKARPPAPQPPPPKVDVVRPGDTLTGIGVAEHRTWAQLAGFNHVPNPNLILVGQRLVVPPESYVPPALVLPAPPPPTPAPVQTPVRQAIVVVSAPQPARRAYQAPAASYGAPGGFQACVALRESGNGSGSSNIYGILDSTWHSLGLSGSAWSASRAQQDAAFATLYARDGIAPWSRYDGCS